MSNLIFNSYYLLEEIPSDIVKIFKDKPANNIEKAKRYDEDMKKASDYIDLLRTEMNNLLIKFGSLKTADQYLNTLKKIQDILNEDISFPAPCAANIEG
jgi:hypothetical protein